MQTIDSLLEKQDLTMDELQEFLADFKPHIQMDFNTVGDIVTEILMGRCPSCSRCSS